ncbi:phage tail protein [Xenorhabdus siamensis]|uniref:phage tail protein n=1 Tax=Xenorhabdus siamensis TaxID=3136254 RepID=UPI0030F376A8
MVKNEFLPFGIADGANVLSNAEYARLAARTNGFGSGVAKSQELNKVWRQASAIATVVAQFIAETTGKDVLDDGNLKNLQAGLMSALQTTVESSVPAASLNTAGITKLSNAIDSNAENIAATSKAVKAVYDMASTVHINDASVTQKGIVQLSNATDSPNESQAATPKAVKTVFDLASKANDNADMRLSKVQNGADIQDKVAFVNNLGLEKTVELARNAVPNSRKINGKSLTADIQLMAHDVSAVSVNALGVVNSEHHFQHFSSTGFAIVNIPRVDEVPDFPVGLYNFGILEVQGDHSIITQRYTSHAGEVAVRQSWDKGHTWQGWFSQVVSDSVSLNSAGWIKNPNTGVITAWITGDPATGEGSMRVALPIQFPTRILNVQVSTKISGLDHFADGFWQVIRWDQSSVTIALQIVDSRGHGREYQPMIYVVGC